MFFLISAAALLITGVSGGGQCTKLSTNQTYFCSGHCCGSPVGEDCCFDGIAQTFTIIALVALFCLLMAGVGKLIMWCNKEEEDVKVESRRQKSKDDIENPTQSGSSDQAVEYDL